MVMSNWQPGELKEAEHIGNEIVRGALAQMRDRGRHVFAAYNRQWVELPDKGPGEIVGDYLNRKNDGVLVVAFPSAATATVVVHLEVSQARFV